MGELKENIREEPGHSPVLRIACLPGNQENSLILQLYQKLTEKVEDFEFILFDEHEEAMKWLGNPE